MSNYIDGFVIPLPKDKIEEYRKVAEKAGALWREHGALEYYECIGDDMAAEQTVPFPQLANAGPEDTVVFSWIAYKSREHRDEVNAKVMADPRMHEMMNPDCMPFDCAKMAYGGFNVLVHA